MVTYLHRNFLNDRCEYAAAEAYWAALWGRIVARAGQTAAWRTGWLQTSYADGSPMNDGNPIFSVICKSRNLAVRIIQHEPESDEMELSYWEDVDMDGVVAQRVISCALSEESAQRAEELIDEWISADSAVSR
jgi:hypothetical protein